MSTILFGVIEKWDWNVNDILVFSSIVIFVLIVCACSLMWTTKPVAKKDIVLGSSTGDRPKSSWAASQLENGGLSGKSKSSNASSKSKEKKKSKKRQKDLEDGIPESSYEGESLLGGRPQGSLSVDLTIKLSCN
jgi:hypothetical protein